MYDFIMYNYIIIIDNYFIIYIWIYIKHNAFL